MTKLLPDAVAEGVDVQSAFRAIGAVLDVLQRRGASKNEGAWKLRITIETGDGLYGNLIVSDMAEEG